MGDRIEELCRRSQAGDAEAASELLQGHYERIFCYFRRLCGTDADAADLTQKTFCKVWKALDSYKGRATFSTWIHGIAHHVYADWRRIKNHFDPQPEEWWLSCVADGPSPFEDAAEREQAAQLYHFVEQLDDATRETIHLHYYQGLTIQETAEALEIATSTVKYRVRSAMEFLKGRLTEAKR
jgi:RNA polymerase sigma-70 factor (ECF subfamily)